MWKNVIQRGRPQMTTQAHCKLIPKATNTYTRRVTLTALPLQQWLHECASMLRYTYIACPFVTGTRILLYTGPGLFF